VYFGVAWFFEDHKIGHVLPAFKDMLSGDGMVDKGNRFAKCLPNGLK
jgi:hypothetical protein